MAKFNHPNDLWQSLIPISACAGALTLQLDSKYSNYEQGFYRLDSLETHEGQMLLC